MLSPLWFPDVGAGLVHGAPNVYFAVQFDDEMVSDVPPSV